MAVEPLVIFRLTSQSWFRDRSSGSNHEQEAGPSGLQEPGPSHQYNFQEAVPSWLQEPGPSNEYNDQENYDYMDYQFLLD